MAVVSLILHFLSSHRFLMLLLGPLAVLLPGWILRLDLRRVGWGGWATVFGLVLLNIFLGPRLNSWFLYHYGTEARAVTTHQEGTNRRYNKTPVLRHHVLLQRPGAPTARVAFDSDQFNLYPSPADGYQYPAPGQPFTVRLVPGAEQNFVILGDDAASPYVQQRRCATHLAALAQAARQYEFDSTSLEFNREYAARIAEYLRAGCGSALLNRHYRQEQQRLHRRLARPAL